MASNRAWADCRSRTNELLLSLNRLHKRIPTSPCPLVGNRKLVASLPVTQDKSISRYELRICRPKRITISAHRRCHARDTNIPQTPSRCPPGRANRFCRFATRGSGPAEIFRKPLRLIPQYCKPPRRDTLRRKLRPQASARSECRHAVGSLYR